MPLSTLPETIRELKDDVHSSRGIPIVFQRILSDGAELPDDCQLLCPERKRVLVLTWVCDESPLFWWDIAGNPDGMLLSGSRELVRYESGEYDYVNVITQEPVRTGVHYFEFIMHRIGDEQWCGVSPSKLRAGRRGGGALGWHYYCGRRQGRSGALHARAERRSIAKFAHVKDGDTIGMLLHTGMHLLAFTLNGVLQGACTIPAEPMYLSTVLDVEEDSVELRKQAVEDFPVAIESLVPIADNLGEDD